MLSWKLYSIYLIIHSYLGPSRTVIAITQTSSHVQRLIVAWLAPIPTATPSFDNNCEVYIAKIMQIENFLIGTKQQMTMIRLRTHDWLHTTRWTVAGWLAGWLTSYSSLPPSIKHCRTCEMEGTGTHAGARELWEHLIRKNAFTTNSQFFAQFTLMGLSICPRACVSTYYWPLSRIATHKQAYLPILIIINYTSSVTRWSCRRSYLTFCSPKKSCHQIMKKVQLFN